MKARAGGGARPRPSEQALIAIWNQIDDHRLHHGEQAAAQLARKALAAIQQPERKGQTDATQT